MKVDRRKLLERLKAVSPGLSDRPDLEQSDCFVFQAGRVTTFDDEVSCSAKSPLEIDGAVKAKPLMELLAKLTENKLEIDLSETKLLVKGKGRRAGIGMQQKVTLPIDDIEKPGKWKPLPDGFIAAVDMAARCASRDESQFVLTCVHFHPERIEATDDVQVIQCPIEMGLEKPTLVRRSSMGHVIGIKAAEFAETENWIHFRGAEGMVLSCRRYMEPYPDLSGVLGVEGVPITLPAEAIASAVDRARIFSSDAVDADDVTVRVELTEGRVEVSGRGEVGWYKERTKTEYDGEPLAFEVGPAMLVEIVKRSGHCHVAEGQLRIEDERFTYVVCTEKVEE